jgi:hypothetical protein
MLEFNQDVDGRARVVLELEEWANPANTSRGNEKPTAGKARTAKFNRKEMIVKATTRHAWNDHSESLETSTFRTRRGIARDMPLTTLLQQLQPHLGFLDKNNTAQRDGISASTDGLDIMSTRRPSSQDGCVYLQSYPKWPNCRKINHTESRTGRWATAFPPGTAMPAWVPLAHISREWQNTTAGETALTPNMVGSSETHRAAETKAVQWHEGPYHQISEYIQAGNGNVFARSAGANSQAMTDYLTTGGTPLASTEHMTTGKGEIGLDVNMLELPELPKTLGRISVVSIVLPCLCFSISAH